MTPRSRSLAPAALLGLVASVAGTSVIGCASPGPPRPPSLQLPAPARSLTVLRRGNIVELRFTLPRTTSDNVPLRTAAITATACRSLGHDACRPVAAARTFPMPPAGNSTEAELTDTLPPELTTGPPRLLVYRVQLANDRGKAAGYSDAAYTAAGSPPATVVALNAQGSRLGVVLTWEAAENNGSKVVLRREDLSPFAPKPAKPEAQTPAQTRSPRKHRGGSNGTRTPPASAVPAEETNAVLLSTGEESGSPQGATTLDTTAVTDEPYRYTAERRRTLELDGRTVELRSSISAPVEFTLRDVFPPPAPETLNAAGYADEKGNYAVDLIWQPVSDPSLAGYNVYRQGMDAAGNPAGPKTRLNDSPVSLPAYHDNTAAASRRYQYSVTALDKKGNESGAVLTSIEPLLR